MKNEHVQFLFLKNILNEFTVLISTMAHLCRNNLLAKEDDQINYQSTQYPVNLLRNTAIRASQSSHVLVVDVDMRTSLNLNHHLLNYMNNKQFLWKQNFAFVIPVFEMPSASKLPENKVIISYFSNKNNFLTSISAPSQNKPTLQEELKELIGRNECRIFYEGVCRKCHQPTDYHKWLSLQLPTLEAAYEVAWKPSWEPFYLVPTTAPLYPEEFEHYGFNRLTQVGVCAQCFFCWFTVISFHIFLRNYDETIQFNNKPQKQKDKLQ